MCVCMSVRVCVLCLQVPNTLLMCHHLNFQNAYTLVLLISILFKFDLQKKKRSANQKMVKILFYVSAVESGLMMMC